MVINFLTRSWQQFFQARVLGAVFALGLIGAVGYYGHSYLSSSREQQAYKAFSESHDFFEQALASDDGKDKEKTLKLWKDVALAFQTGYTQNKKSTLAPYFLAFQAEALIHQGELNQAVDVMNQMLGSLKKDSPFFGLYAAKRALMKLDMPDDAANKAGLEELLALANEEVNPHRDMALYYLGEYYWVNNEREKAHISWRYLANVAQFGKSPTPSPWFDLVKARTENTI